MIGIGIIAQDREGRVIVTMRMNKTMFPNPFLAETFRTLHAMFGLELGLRNIILESDCLQVVNVNTKVKESWTSAGIFVKEIKEKLRSFTKWPVHQVRREINVVAQVLAKMPCSFMILLFISRTTLHVLFPKFKWN